MSCHVTRRRYRQVRKVTENVPGMEWPEIRVYADYNQDKKVKDNADYFGDFRQPVPKPMQYRCQ